MKAELLIYRSVSIHFGQGKNEIADTRGGTELPLKDVSSQREGEELGPLGAAQSFEEPVDHDACWVLPR